jgi:hypothetical protein
MAAQISVEQSKRLFFNQQNVSRQPSQPGREAQKAQKVSS